MVFCTAKPGESYRVRRCYRACFNSQSGCPVLAEAVLLGTVRSISSMRHKHSIRGGNPNAASSVRDAYGFEVCAFVCLLHLLAAKGLFLLVPPQQQHQHLLRSRRKCSVCIKSTPQYGKRKKLSAQSDGMRFWLILRLCTRKMCQTSEPAVITRPACSASLQYLTFKLHRQEVGAPLQQLEQACQTWAAEDRGASKELNDWQHQLRSLVQAGIPMVWSFSLF